MPGRLLTFEVSEDDIKLGVPGSSAYCPIALALWWRIPGHKEIHEDGTVIIYPLKIEVRPNPCKRGRWYRIQVPDRKVIAGHFKLPEEAVRWMKTFDETGKGAPAVFTVEVPELKGDSPHDKGHQEDPGEPRGL